ncbi:ChrR family anti-sigma-E factor [Histidinibacterium aquaticum]|uniref:Transcriptional regulator n=1 Tax=Histidinibacterium aquaticum TaxID=2613962 RepID=A0A5J5GCZ7_9RHOB|nr:ChrR family anti-sigma-E factor [Histidinibacterium aquaticum]KAA9006045.1 transcriptional regulator [Histidinibacterium aquaticum]
MTRQIAHHLPDAMLRGYCAGTLPEAFDLVVASHISLCDECRARMHAFDAVGGALLDQADEAELSEDSLAATFRLIEGIDVEKAKAEETPPPATSGVLPAPLRSYVGGDLDAVSWKRVGGGVSQAILPVEGDASVRLLRIPGGVEVPDHSHSGSEMTLVLAGAFSDAAGRFGPGDVEMADDDVTHTPIAEPGEDCICLAATEAPLRFSGLLPRLAQKVMRI